MNYMDDGLLMVRVKGSAMILAACGREKEAQKLEACIPYLEGRLSKAVPKDYQVSQTTQALIDMLVSRDFAGRQKYGSSLDRTDLSPSAWLQHMTEELLDGAGYALAVKREMEVRR